MNISLKAKLNVMAGTAILAVAVLTFMGYLLAKNTAIGSNTYNRIDLTGKFVADIAPPALFMVEAANTAERLRSLDKSQRVEPIKEVKKHFQQFDELADKWGSSTDLPTDVVADINKRLKPQGKEFQSIVNKEVLEPAARGDEEALSKGLIMMEKSFTDHEAIVYDIVERASKLNQKEQSDGISKVHTYETLLEFFAAISVALVLLFSVYFSKLILQSLGADPEALKNISNSVANGNFDIKIEQKNDGSVINAIAKMVDALHGSIGAINRSQAVIEFSMDGRILTANDNFLKAMGYSLQEIVGKHHSIFVDSKDASSAEYSAFWQKLNRGEFDASRYKRLDKGGKTVWIQASYNPILDRNNNPYKVIKFANVITEQVNKDADYIGQIEAINRVQAVIEFDMKGNIMSANENFLNVLGYQLNEVKGRHHSMFVDTDSRQSSEYTAFWQRLGRGEYDAGQYKRISKSGKEIWIQASYNPIFDSSNIPYKVVKYATDITAQVEAANILKNTVADIKSVVERAADKDLKTRVDTNGKTGELKNLCSGVNELLDAQVDILVQLKVVAEEIYTGASEIAKGNSDLSSRTEQQAANLEETASSMEELTSTVKLNADNAKQANALAERASIVASDGGALIQQVVVTMSSINESSQKIADIIGVIDGIAFQTNILALNAAVEAARAGDQGRGFAVVASEVRTLAQRSANAAKDIKALISDSVKKIENGNTLVGKSGDTMKEIVTSIKRVNDIMAEIAAASAEQSAGIEEISTAVSQMDEMTQQNAALVEQAAAAAESLQSQADQLTQRVGQFTLSDDSGGSLNHGKTSARISAPTAKKLATPTKKLSPPQNQDDEWESF